MQAHMLTQTHYPRKPIAMIRSRAGVVTVTMAYALPFVILLAVILFKMSSLLLAVTYLSPFTEKLAREHGGADSVSAFIEEFNASPMTFWCEGDGIEVSKRQFAFASGSVFEVIDIGCAFNLLPSWMGEGAVLDLEASHLWRRLSQ